MTVVSKNNQEDALEVFRSHPYMLLKEDDFAAMKINWRHKSDNIRDLADELNLGLESFVFIDDNPVEREMVRTTLPQVVVPDFPEDTTQLADFADEIYHRYFYTLTVTSEDLTKTKMYIDNAKRMESMKQAESFEDFLASLQTKLIINKANPEDVERIVQLTQKTNQFNLTTHRYTSADIEKFMQSPSYSMYVFSVKDRFGSYGKVGLAIVKYDGSNAVLDTFLMSCRVMGHHIEDLAIKHIEQELAGSGYTALIAEFIPTAKNAPVRDLFERLGYGVIEHHPDGYKKYIGVFKKIDEKDRLYFGEVIQK